MPPHRKPKGQRKELTIRLRVTSEQRRLMLEAAEQTGLDLSAWLRTLGVREARKTLSAGSV